MLFACKFQTCAELYQGHCNYGFVGMKVVEKGRVCGCTSLLGQESVIKMY